MLDLQVVKIQGQELKKTDMRVSDLLSMLKFEIDQGLESNRQAETLKTLIGENRLKRICLRQGKDFNSLMDGQSILTKKMMHEILVGMADIQFEEIEELGGDGASTETLDRLYHSLLPPKKNRELFSASSLALNYYDKATSFGHDKLAVEQRVWAILQHKEKVELGDNPSNLEFEDLEFLSSRLADREPPAGTLVKLSTGYYTLEKMFLGGGALITFWRNISNERPPIIVCRGTAFRSGATEAMMSGVNDLLPEIGFYGIMTVWPELKRYLEDNGVESVAIFGKSLGGAHAQYLTTLITGLTETRVSTLKTYCSLGTPESVHKCFNDALNLKSAPQIEAYRNIGSLDDDEVDFIPLLGGHHLHAPSNTRVIYVLPKKSFQDGEVSQCDEAKRNFVKEFHEPKTIFKNLRGLLKSFGKAHPRQNSLKGYTFVEVSDIEAEVKVGAKLESFRSQIANVFNVCTFYTFHTESFEEYYFRQQKNKDD